MTAERFRRHWSWISLKARVAFPVLSANDLEVIGGEKALFVGILGRRTGWETGRIDQWLDDLLRSPTPREECEQRVPAL